MPPPPVITRPSGSRSAVEWYCRTRAADASVLHVFVVVLYSSAANTGWDRSTVLLTAPEYEPPVASALPSARTVRLNCRRAFAIGAASVTIGGLVFELTSLTVLVGTLVWPPSVMMPPPATIVVPGLMVAKLA